MPSAFKALLLFALLLQPVAAQEVRVLLQSSPLAGFRYHDAAALWAQMHVGDALELIREADNPNDPKAIRVDWRGHKLGYVPRAQNDALAWALDQGQRVSARISRMQEHPDPRQRIEFEVYVE